MTAVMAAAENGHVSCLELLIRHGADIHAQEEVSGSVMTVPL